MVKKVTRKVITRKISQTGAPAQEAVAPAKPASEEAKQAVKIAKKVCGYCQSKKIPAYTDIATLKRYVTDRAKIVSHLRNNLCSKHQRAVARQIKYARHLALLPFTPKV